MHHSAHAAHAKMTIFVSVVDSYPRPYSYGHSDMQMKSEQFQGQCTHIFHLVQTLKSGPKTHKKTHFVAESGPFGWLREWGVHCILQPWSITGAVAGAVGILLFFEDWAICVPLLFHQSPNTTQKNPNESFDSFGFFCVGTVTTCSDCTVTV